MIALDQAGLVARQEIRMLLQGKETLLWLFVMPVLFFYFIGTITSRMGVAPTDVPDAIEVERGDEAGFLADRLEIRLAARGFRLAEAGEKVSRRLVLPPRFTASVLAGEPVSLELVDESEGLGREFDDLRVGRAVFGLLAETVVVEEPTAASLSALDELPRTLSVRVESAGRRRHIPTGFEQAVPGIMVMFTLLVLLSSGAAQLVVERDRGLLRRLASTPIPRGSVVLGKWAGRLALGLVQIAFAMLAGSLLFGMDWGPSLPAVLALMLCWGSLCASLGLYLGVLARTPGQAGGIGAGATNLLAALGGCWWPIEITPDWMQKLAAWVPTGWAMDALHKLVSFGEPASSVAPHATALLLASLLFGALAARRFRFV